MGAAAGRVGGCRRPAATYAAWLQEADRLIGQPGLSVHTVDMDVEELICAANLAQGPVDRRFRTGFVRQKAGLQRAA